jgi:superfamily I DNA/RNA helicase
MAKRKIHDFFPSLKRAAVAPEALEVSVGVEAQNGSEFNEFDVTPTEEQRAILARLPQPGERIGVIARAGAAKSTTARMLAQKFPETQMLYVVFNKAMQLEAQKSMPSNVTCSTFSALATAHWFKHHPPKNGGGKPGKLLCNVTELRNAIENCIKTLNDQELEEVANTAIGWSADKQRRLNYAPVRRVFDRLTHICNNMPEIATVDEMLKHLAPILSNNEKLVLNNLLPLMQKHLDQGNMLPMMAWAEWQMAVSKTQHSAFKVIIMDEAQDLNRTMVEWARNQTDAGVILLGDPLQRIYGFRGCVDAVAEIQCDRVLPLTSSFRFGPAIAGVANALVRGWVPKGDQDPGPMENPTVGGGPPNSRYCFEQPGAASRVFYDTLKHIRQHKKKTCGLIFRTRAGLLSYLFKVDHEHVVRIANLKKLKTAVKCALNRVEKKLEKQEKQGLSGHVEEMFAKEEEVEEEEDEEDGIVGLCKFVEENLDWCKLFISENCPWKIKKGGKKKWMDAMTVHGAKGLQFHIVIIGDDFRDPFAEQQIIRENLLKENDDEGDHPHERKQRDAMEEMHIANVALTRCIETCFNHSDVINRAIQRGMCRAENDEQI